MEEDGFTLVKRRGRDGQRKIIEAHEQAQASTSGSEAKEEERVNGSLQDIRKAITMAMHEVEQSNMFKWLKIRLEKVLDGRKLGMISVLGNGHFDSPFEDGTYQLAMCLLLRQLYKAEFDFREPVCTAMERLWLELDLEDVEPQESKPDTECCHLIVLIHGIASLHEDILKSRWRPDSLDELILICNHISDTALPPYLRDPPEYPAYAKFLKIGRFEEFPEFAKRRNAFANTALAYWKKEFGGTFPI
ncbi:hypothetical protein WR25_05114 [Diploscapter pachys]|uniref:SRR1-like domain-containing protein n=1 Tax=Diploscapter pachys TaxID=2018661 RepID=A0A2A2K591_9BILA|nr:hypothetical protein WR25_05114 [Diploscapter pachys]